MAWKLTVHNDAISELGPSYDGCPTHCTRDERDQKNKCPDCSVTILYGQLVEELQEEMDDLARERGHQLPHRWPWSMNRLMSDVNTISSLDAQISSRGYNPSWTVPTKRLVICLRNERYSLRRSKELERRKGT